MPSSSVANVQENEEIQINGVTLVRGAHCHLFIACSTQPDSTDVSMLTFCVANLTSNLVNGLCQSLDVAACNSGDGDTAVLCGVHGSLQVKSVWAG
jgi:hypothetical protein